VYLAGPITGLTYDDGQEWRQKLKLVFGQVGIDAFSPLRQQQYLKKFGVLDAGGMSSSYFGAHPLTNPAGITDRDRSDVMNRDAVLVNLLGAEKASIGSVLEIGWADAYRKPLVVVMEEGNVHDHAMIYGCAGFVTDDLDVAVDTVKAVLLP
jgi:nucleoside 2-deoxyribosyltransferase